MARLSNQQDLIGSPLTFRNGVHPAEYKDLTDHSAIERMPFVKEYTLPLSQHIGIPSKAIVKKGQQVRKGEMIGQADGFVSVALHSPVDGTVTAVDLFRHPTGQLLPGVRIKPDPFSSQISPERPIPLESLDAGGFVAAIQSAGIVGLGGAAFPAHVKLNLPEGKNCRYLVVNGCECEPFLTADHRLMAEHPKEVVDGIRVMQHFLKAEKIFIGIEINKMDAISALHEIAKKSELPIEVVPLKVKYPQGAEKMLLTAILQKEIPSGKLPLDLETLTYNVGTVVAISNYFRKSETLTDRIVTVTGTAIRRPANVRVPIGTPMQDVVELCGGITHDAARILLGGPMMGVVQKSLDVPVIKGTSGILVLTENEVREIEQYSCIRCGRCLEACPLFLNPSLLGFLAKRGFWDEMLDNNVMDCFECAACSYVCPSGIPLVQSFRVGKAMIREAKARDSA